MVVEGWREVSRKELLNRIKAEFLVLYKRGGIDKVSVGGICTGCGIARSTFYYYFDDKYKVLESIEDELISALWEINYPEKWDVEAVCTGIPLNEVTSTLECLEENRHTFQILPGPYGDLSFDYKWRKVLNLNSGNVLNRYMAIYQSLKSRAQFLSLL